MRQRDRVPTIKKLLSIGKGTWREAAKRSAEISGSVKPIRQIGMGYTYLKSCQLESRYGYIQYQIS